MKLHKKMDLAAHSVDLAWMILNQLTEAELEGLTPEMRQFKSLVERARDVSYDIIDELNRESCREALRLRLVD